MSFLKEDLPDRVVYTHTTKPGVKYILYKEDVFHLEIVAPWEETKPDLSTSWQEYGQRIEEVQ